MRHKCMRGGDVLSGWGKILRGKLPLLSIEITSECPLSCPGCYAYGDRHLGGGVTLTQLSDSRGETLVQGILRLVDQHDPMQLSLVGGEPMMRHRELSQLLPIRFGSRNAVRVGCQIAFDARNHVAALAGLGIL